MAVRHDFSCSSCDRVFEDMVDPVTLPAGPACLTCGAPTERVWLSPSSRSLPDAVVVYRAPDGSFRFPGETGGSSCAKYEAMGYQRVEARGFAEVRVLERRLNAHERSQMARNEERKLAQIEATEGARRSETRRSLEQGFSIPETYTDAHGQIRHTGRRQIVRLSPRGRDQLRAIIDRNDAKGHRRDGDPGIHVDAYANTRSNRDESRRADGHRHRD